MNFVKGLLLIMVIAATSAAFAVDHDIMAPPSVDSGQNRTSSSPKKTTACAGSQRWSLVQYDRSICYTIRAYRVKRTERVINGQTALRAYSTCEMAADYTLRSADWQTHGPDQK